MRRPILITLLFLAILGWGVRQTPLAYSSSAPPDESSNFNSPSQPEILFSSEPPGAAPVATTPMAGTVEGLPPSLVPPSPLSTPTAEPPQTAPKFFQPQVVRDEKGKVIGLDRNGDGRIEAMDDNADGRPNDPLDADGDEMLDLDQIPDGQIEDYDFDILLYAYWQELHALKTYLEENKIAPPHALAELERLDDAIEIVIVLGQSYDLSAAILGRIQETHDEIRKAAV